MFKKVMVPLDGSPAAERVIPLAAAIARASSGAVVLIHVIERSAPAKIHGEVHLTGVEEAEIYLKEIATSRFSSDIPVMRHVHSRQVENIAHSITDHADEFFPDIIVMCSHGNPTLTNRLYGTVPQQIIGMGITPVLLVRNPSEAAPCGSFNRICVPLDGDKAHECVLPAAAGVARLFGSSIHLVTAAAASESGNFSAGAASFLPASAKVLAGMEREGAAAYLQNLLGGEILRGIICQGTVLQGDPAAEIAAFTRAQAMDLIAVGTHGKAGIKAFWEGSLSAKLLAKIGVSFLMVPAPAA